MLLNIPHGPAAQEIGILKSISYDRNIVQVLPAAFIVSFEGRRRNPAFVIAAA